MSKLTPGSIHTLLRLPRTFTIAKSVAGWDTTKGFSNAKHYELRMMTSETHGHQPVFGVSHAYGPWKEITSEEFTEIAKRVLSIKT